MNAEIRKTHVLFQTLMAQIHKDNEVLQGLIQAYSQNVDRLIDLATKLSERLDQEDAKENASENGGLPPVK